MAEIDFLTLEDVLEIHARQLELYGGMEGILDRGVVESAAAAPQASMFGEYLNADIAEMAAAYLFSFAASQGFVDGNKRTGAACAITFLGHNGYRLDCSDDDLYEATMRIANRQISKGDLADWIAEHLDPLV